MSEDAPREVGTGEPPQHAPHMSAVGWVMLALVVVMALALIAPVVESHAAPARLSACHANLVMLAKAVAMYGTDYDEHLPPADSWADKISRYIQVSPSEAPWPCPADRRSQKQTFPPWLPDQKEPSQTSYTMSRACGGANMKMLKLPTAWLGVLFDGDSLAGDHTSGVARHEGALNVSFADGHVTYAPEREWPQVVLDPAPPGVPAPPPPPLH